MPNPQVMNMLHRLYRQFDELSTKHGVFKVEVRPQ